MYSTGRLQYSKSIDFAGFFTELFKPGLEDELVVRLLKGFEETYISDFLLHLNQSADVTLSQGIAINSNLAAQCFSDYLRTHRFMLGSYQCALDLLHQKPVIRVLYAGTGPFATIVLPMLYLFSPEQIRITTLEINHESYHAMKRFISHLGKEAFFQSILLQDAITYTSDEAFDIVISETMDKALTREPQLAVFNNLIQFLSPNGFMVPECITVKVYASPVSLEKVSAHNELGNPEARIYNQPLRTLLSIALEADKAFFELHELIVNQDLYLKTISTRNLPANSTELVFITEVTIYNEIKLLEDDSFVTRKYVAYSMTADELGRDFELYYTNKKSPGFLLKPKV